MSHLKLPVPAPVEPLVSRRNGYGVHDPVRQESAYIDHVSQAKPGIKVFDDRLHVIAVISNPARYHTRYELYRTFERHVEDAGAVLHTVEIAFGNRKHEVIEDGLDVVRLRTNSEMWHKENMINIGIQNLPRDWNYVAWIDADVQFVRPDWVQETIQQLQHYKVVQMFSHAQDIGPNYEQLGCATSTFQSFAHSYVLGRPLPYYGKPQNDPYNMYPFGRDMRNWHSGYAWAARREAIDDLGGLIDWAILGSADHNMAGALIGMVEHTFSNAVHPNFRQGMLDWQERAERYIRRNIGCVEGTLLHYWHGKKADRRYVDRWQVLVEHQYDPLKDIKRDWQGVYQLVDHGDLRSIKFRDDLRRYFRQRNEDGTAT